MMDADNHLLTILAEECAEVIQRITKLQRFGATEVQKDQPFDNIERVAQEMDDLLAVREILVSRGLLRDVYRTRMSIKKSAVEKYMDYSKERGEIT